jgi:hypothetical protein
MLKNKWLLKYDNQSFTLSEKNSSNSLIMTLFVDT